MFLARSETPRGPVVGVGLRPEDLRALQEGRPASFALRDALCFGSEEQQRVLLAYARPHELEQMRHGYFPGLTDARIVLFVDHAGLQRLHGGGTVHVQTPGAPIPRFVLFTGRVAEDARRPMQEAVRIMMTRQQHAPQARPQGWTSCPTRPEQPAAIVAD